MIEEIWASRCALSFLRHGVFSHVVRGVLVSETIWASQCALSRCSRSFGQCALSCCLKSFGRHGALSHDV